VGVRSAERTVGVAGTSRRAVGPRPRGSPARTPCFSRASSAGSALPRSRAHRPPRRDPPCQHAEEASPSREKVESSSYDSLRKVSRVSSPSPRSMVPMALRDAGSAATNSDRQSNRTAMPSVSAQSNRSSALRARPRYASGARAEGEHALPSPAPLPQPPTAGGTYPPGGPAWLRRSRSPDARTLLALVAQRTSLDRFFLSFRGIGFRAPARGIGERGTVGPRRK